MIQTFSALQNTGTDAQSLAGGISKAMINNFFGALCCYLWYNVSPPQKGLECKENKIMKYTKAGGIILCFLTTGCAGKWVWQEDYPKHRTMSLKCPRWNYDETYNELHHIYTTKQHEPIKID